MANKRIKDISTTASTLAADDYVAVDGNANGTRKIVKGDLVNDISTQVAGTYLDEANNLSDVASKDTSKLNLEVPDVGTAPNEVPLNGQLGSMAYQSADSVAMGTVSVSDKVDGSLGINTTPTATVEVTDATTNVAAVRVTRRSDLASTYLEMGTTGGSGEVRSTDNLVLAADLDDNGADSAIQFKVDGTQKAVIDSSGRLGVNQTSPGSYNAAADDLVVGDGSGDRGLTIASGNASQGGLYFADGTSGSDQYAGGLIYYHNLNRLDFYTAGGAAATIDSSGRLGVTNTSPGDYHSNARNLVVGDATGNRGITIASGTTGSSTIHFADGTSGTERYRGFASYTHSNDALSFGTGATTQWQINSSGDLVAYSAGNGIDFGAVASGTGTVVPTTGGTLDDFERGSFTPSFTSTGTAPTLTYLAQVGTYTKVGNLVTCHGRVRVNAVTGAGTGSLQISGLPFATQNVSNLGSGGAVCLAAFFGTSSSGCPTHISGGNNATVMTLKTLKNSAGVVASLDNTDAADLAGSCYVDFSITYTTA